MVLFLFAYCAYCQNDVPPGILDPPASSWTDRVIAWAKEDVGTRDSAEGPAYQRLEMLAQMICRNSPPGGTCHLNQGSPKLVKAAQNLASYVIPILQNKTLARCSGDQECSAAVGALIFKWESLWPPVEEPPSFFQYAAADAVPGIVVSAVGVAAFLLAIVLALAWRVFRLSMLYFSVAALMFVACAVRLSWWSLYLHGFGDLYKISAAAVFSLHRIAEIFKFWALVLLFVMWMMFLVEKPRTQKILIALVVVIGIAITITALAAAIVTGLALQGQKNSSGDVLGTVSLLLVYGFEFLSSVALLGASLFAWFKVKGQASSELTRSFRQMVLSLGIIVVGVALGFVYSILAFSTAIASDSIRTSALYWTLLLVFCDLLVCSSLLFVVVQAFYNLRLQFKNRTGSEQDQPLLSVSLSEGENYAPPMYDV